MTTYMICNLIGMSSTCTNPILYGFLTQNIQEVLMHGVSVVTDKICYCLDGFKVSLLKKEHIFTLTVNYNHFPKFQVKIIFHFFYRR